MSDGKGECLVCHTIRFIPATVALGTELVCSVKGHRPRIVTLPPDIVVCLTCAKPMCFSSYDPGITKERWIVCTHNCSDPFIGAN